MQAVINQAHPEWHGLLSQALSTMDPHYLETLCNKQDWLPGSRCVFAAFSLPLSKTRYILFGESPYPRAQSANGYAFWDQNVHQLWSESGMSKAVNRATSLRNWIKMLLHARNDLTHDFSQAAIASLDKSHYLQTAEQLFQGLINQGFLLLNASLVYSEGQVQYHARQWRPFVASLLQQLQPYREKIQLILLGRIAEQIPQYQHVKVFVAEHPYNVSFITNPNVIEFFKPFDLLAKS